MLVIERQPGVMGIDNDAVLFAVLKNEFVVRSTDMMNCCLMACLRDVLIEHNYIKTHRNTHATWFECIQEFTLTFQGRGSYVYEEGVQVDTFFKDILHAEEMFN